MASTTIYTCDVCGEEADEDGLKPLAIGVSGCLAHFNEVKVAEGDLYQSQTCGPCRSEAIRFLKARRSRASGRIDV